MALSLRRKLLERGQLGQLAFIATQTDTWFPGARHFPQSNSFSARQSPSDHCRITGG
jgi:hypothetical protein